ncbi:MAG TPA: hypothetical protein RMH99_02630 [Sandaracinaceae bacterium LLY-WYZ-13_1]|nr:hypothetical protein [Sandaracinaceae bacterium LLY-WYZ-13_1]
MRGRATFAAAAALLAAGCHLVLDPARHERGDGGPSTEPDAWRPDAGPTCEEDASCGPASIARCVAGRCELCLPAVRDATFALDRLSGARDLALVAAVADGGPRARIVLTGTSAATGASVPYAAEVRLDDLGLEGDGFGLPDAVTWAGLAPRGLTVATGAAADGWDLGALTDDGDEVLWVDPPDGALAPQVARAALEAGETVTGPLRAVGGAGARSFVWPLARVEGTLLAAAGPPDWTLARSATVADGPDEGVLSLFGSRGAWVAAAVGETSATRLELWRPADGARARVEVLEPQAFGWLGDERYALLSAAGDLIELDCGAARCEAAPPRRIDGWRGGPFGAVSGSADGALVVGTAPVVEAGARRAVDLVFLGEALEPFDAGALGRAAVDGDVVRVAFGDPVDAPVERRGFDADRLEVDGRPVLVAAWIERATAPREAWAVRVVVVDGCGE